MADQDFPRLVSLACHDLRTPLATVNGFAKTLIRSGQLEERDARFVAMIDEAAGQLSELLDGLGLAARIAAGRYEPATADADTRDLATSSDERIGVEGEGQTIETDVDAIRRSLEALAIAAIRHGRVATVTWTVAARELTLSPVTSDAAPIVDGRSPRDLGSLVARMAIEQLGGSLAVEGETLRVRL